MTFVSSAETFRNKALEWLSDSIFSREKEHPLGRAIEEYDALLVVDGDNCIHRGTDDPGKLLLAAAQILLGSFALSNVHHGAMKTHPVAGCVAIDPSPRLQPAKRSVFLLDAILDVVIAARLNRMFERAGDTRPIFVNNRPQICFRRQAFFCGLRFN